MGSKFGNFRNWSFQGTYFTPRGPGMPDVGGNRFTMIVTGGVETWIGLPSPNNGS
jgi:hypothetical protein